MAGHAETFRPTHVEKANLSHGGKAWSEVQLSLAYGLELKLRGRAVKGGVDPQLGKRKERRNGEGFNLFIGAYERDGAGNCSWTREGIRRI